LVQRPIQANKALLVLVLRALGVSQGDVALMVHRRKAAVGHTEHWFSRDLSYSQAVTFADDQIVKQIAASEFASLGLTEEELEKAQRITGDDILRHFRTEEHLENASHLARHLDPIQMQHYLEKIRSHWDSLLGVLQSMGGCGVFPPDAREILTWMSRYPTVSQ
jgi:hypothetical protein